MQININQITIDEAIYPRSAVDSETVERYREALESGAKQINAGSWKSNLRNLKSNCWIC